MSRPGHLGAPASPAGVRRLHGPAHSRSGAGRREAGPDDHRSAVRGRVRPGLAQPDGPDRHQTHRPCAERRPGRLARAWALFGGEVAYVWHGALHATTVAETLQACGFELRAQIVWAKDALVLGRGHYHWTHEPCWYGVRAGGNGHWHGDRPPDDALGDLGAQAGRHRADHALAHRRPRPGRRDGPGQQIGAAAEQGRRLQAAEQLDPVGEVAHKGQVYPGEHQAIVPRELWDRAHASCERPASAQTRTGTRRRRC